jgi:hypothetical protein
MARIRIALAVAVMLAATAVFAQTRFTIESIDVESAPRIASIVRAETRLVAGRAYTEDQIRQGVYRARRLPFVAGATYRLTPGKSEDSRILVITIVDERRLNYTASVDGSHAAQENEAISSANIGYRYFAGANGVVDGTFGGQVSSQESDFRVHSLSLAYSGYGLFGTSAFAQIGASRDVGSSLGYRDTTMPFAVVGIPLTQTQTLRTSYTRSTYRLSSSFAGLAEPVRTRYAVSELGTAWVLETTDDPFFMRRGTTVSIGPRWTRASGDAVSVEGLPNNPVVQRAEVTTKTMAWTGTGEQFWPIADAFAAFVRANVESEHFSSRANGNHVPGFDTFSHLELIGGAWNLDADPLSRHRFELAAGHGGSRTRRVSGTFSDSGYAAMAGYAYRNRWGLLHLTFTYNHD